MDRIYLEGVFFLHPKSKSSFHVKITGTGIAYIHDDNGVKAAVRSSSTSSTSMSTQSLRLSGSGASGASALSRSVSFSSSSSTSNSGDGFLTFDDIIGSDCQKGRNPEDSKSAFLCIYAYPHHKKLLSKKTFRKRTTLTLTFDQKAEFGENFAECLLWKHVIHCLERKDETPRTEDVNSWPSPPERKYLVLINPFSGPGKALQLFQQRVFPIFAEAGLQHVLIVTKHAGHAKEIVRSMKVDDWYGIVIVSGDGLIHEAVNGLMERPDWEKAIKTPIGALPGGSGNALCTALLHGVGEPYMDSFVTHSTFLLIKHVIMPMDLVAVDLCTEKRLYSFLAIAWGLIADVDIGSEKFRSLGNSRFAVEAVAKIAGLRKYRGRLSFLPIDRNYIPKRSQHKRTSSQSAREPSPSTLEDCNNGAKKTTRKLPDNERKPLPVSNGDNFALTTTSENCLNNDGNGDSVECGATSTNTQVNGDNEIRNTSFNENAEAVKATRTNGSPEVLSIATPLLPRSIHDPVPADWLTIEDDFVTVLASIQTHLSHDTIVAPESRLNDNIIFLAFVHAGISRMRLVRMFSAMEEGRSVAEDDPYVELVPVHAFRLVPLSGGASEETGAARESQGGILTVDGEVVPYGPIQAQILPSAARVMTLVDKRDSNTRNVKVFT